VSKRRSRQKYKTRKEQTCCQDDETAPQSLVEHGVSPSVVLIRTDALTQRATKRSPESAAKQLQFILPVVQKLLYLKCMRFKRRIHQQNYGIFAGEKNVSWRGNQ